MKVASFLAATALFAFTECDAALRSNRRVPEVSVLPLAETPSINRYCHMVKTDSTVKCATNLDDGSAQPLPPSSGNGNRELSGSSPSSQVTTFQLINADTDQKIVDLEDGMVIALDAIPNMTSPSFNINATVAGSNIQSVKFGYNSTSNQQIENNAFYAFCGNMRRDFYRCDKLGLGTHTIMATPYSRSWARGTAGTPLTMTITIVESDTTKPKLLNFVALTPTTVDVTNGPATVEFQFTVQDDASGIRGGILGYGSSIWLFENFWYAFGRDIVELTSLGSVPSVGAKNNDPVTFNVIVKVRQFTAPGSYPLQLYPGDEMNNIYFVTDEKLANASFVDRITVVNSNIVDTTPVTLVSIRALSPLTVNISMGTTMVDFEVVIEDDIAGFENAVLMAFSDDGYTEASLGKGGAEVTQWADNSPSLPAGVPHTFNVSVPFGVGPLRFGMTTPVGTYKLELFALDGVKNPFLFTPTILAANGFPSIVTVVS